MQKRTLCPVTISFARPKENAPHEAGHCLILVAWGGIEPPTQGFSIEIVVRESAFMRVLA